MPEASVCIYYKELKIAGSLPKDVREDIGVLDKFFVETTTRFADTPDVTQHLQKVEAECGKKVDAVTFSEHTLLVGVVRDFLYRKDHHEGLSRIGFALLSAFANKNPELFQEQAESGEFVVNIESLLEQYGLNVPAVEKSLCLSQVIDKQVYVVGSGDKLADFASEDLKGKANIAKARSIEYDPTGDTPILYVIDLDTREQLFYCKADYDAIYGDGEFDRLLVNLMATV